MKQVINISKKPCINWIGSESIDERFDCKYYSNNYIEVINKISRMKNAKLREFVVNKRSEPPIHTTMYGDKSKGDIPIIRFTDFTDFEFDLSNCLYLKKHYINNEIISSFLLKPKTIVFGLVGDVGHAFVVPENVPDAITYRRVAQLQLKNIDEYYVVTFLNTFYSKVQFDALSTGVNQAQLRLEDSIEILIPIPSPEIQKYIGDKVRKAEELREEAKRLKKEAEEIINESLNIKQLDFLWEGSKVKFEWTSTEILTDRIDANYYEQKYVETINHIKKFSEKYITLNSIIDSIYTGKKPIYYEKGIEAYFVQSGNISSNFLELDNKEKVDLSKYNQILFGDLLIAKDGETIGKIAINLTNETIIINEHTYCVRLKDEYKCYSAYIYYFLTNKYINPLIRREATGSAQKGLNFTFTENIIIPILEEDRIMNLYNLEVRRCNNIYKSKQLIQEAKQDVEDLIEGNFDMSKIKAHS